MSTQTSNTVMTVLQGKKTYIIGGITIAVALAEAFGYPIPDNVIEILAGAGLITLRHGIKRDATAAK